MEIVSYVLGGELGHKDSMGTGSVIRPGDVQRMSAGTGVTHSEWNHSKTEYVHFLQIWILPDRRGITPSYEQKTLPPEETQNQLRLVASPEGRDGSVTVHQDAEIYVAKLRGGTRGRAPDRGRPACLDPGGARRGRGERHGARRGRRRRGQRRGAGGDPGGRGGGGSGFRPRGEIALRSTIARYVAQGTSSWQ